MLLFKSINKCIPILFINDSLILFSPDKYVINHNDILSIKLGIGFNKEAKDEKLKLTINLNIPKLDIINVHVDDNYEIILTILSKTKKIKTIEIGDELGKITWK